MPPSNIPIAENWMIDGWSGYHSFVNMTNPSSIGVNPNPPNFLQSLVTQNHVDLRTFATTTENWQATLNGVPYAWSGSYGSLSGSFNHWPGMIINLASNALAYSFTSTVGLVNLSTLNPASLITLALPSFPLGDINLSTSFLDISSNGFSTQTDSLAFANSTTALVSGNSTATWPLSSLVNSNRTAITDVRIRLVVPTSCTLIMMALRAIDPGWRQTSVDFDNFNGWLRQCIPLNGDPTTVPVAGEDTISSLWRAAPGRPDDPQPIDSTVGVVFNTGSQTQQNSFTIYMREISQPGITQQQLGQLTQAQLTGQPQPQYGPDDGIPRAMNFKVAWGAVNLIQVTNYDNPGGGYTWGTTTLNSRTSYLAVCSLQGNTARLIIYSLNQTTFAIQSVIFDTGPIADTYLFIRRAGRIGFQAYLNDGDAYLRSIRPRNLIFAEYRSAPLTSITPVAGANLFVNDTPDTELWTGWSLLASTAGTVLQGDPVRQLSGLSSAVSILNPNIAGQGIISNPLTPPADPVSGIIDMTHVTLGFDLWFPSAALVGGATLQASLLSVDGATIPLTMPAIAPDQWQSIELTPASVPIQNGLYSLVLTYVGTVAGGFWVDNVSVTETAIGWSARSVVSDPWNSNYAPWTDFGDLINSYSDGVHFAIRGNNLQLRGQAYRQDAVVIGYPKLIPQYAQLGRLVWPENAAPSNFNTTAPSGSITPTNVGRAFTFVATSLVSTNGIISLEWSFGDGQVTSGTAATHTYAAAGTYVVFLTITDAAGLVTLASTTITVT